MLNIPAFVAMLLGCNVFSAWQYRYIVETCWFYGWYTGTAIRLTLTGRL